MDSEIFEKLPPTRLFFRLAVPSMITMAFGALYQIADGVFVGLNGVWLSALASCTASAIFTFTLYLTMKHTKKDQI